MYTLQFGYLVYQYRNLFSSQGIWQTMLANVAEYSGIGKSDFLILVT